MSFNIFAEVIKPVSLMRLSEIDDPDELLTDYNRDDIIIEPKGDGWKTQIIKTDGEIKIYSRKGEDKTENFPEIVEALKYLPDKTFVEGELIYWENGKQDIGKVTSLAGSKPETSKEKAKEFSGKIKLHLYDILWLKGKNISKRPFSERRKELENVIRPNKLVELMKEYKFSDWETAMNNAVKEGGEGIVLKIKSKPYEYKTLGENEPKPKIMFKYKGGAGKSESDDYVVYDYETTEKGNLKALFGQYYKGKLYHISDIGNFSEENEKKIRKKLLDGKFVIEIGFQERVPGGLRHQKFVRFRDDKSPKDATMNEFHVKNIKEFKVVSSLEFKLSKRADDGLPPDKLLIELLPYIKKFRMPGAPRVPSNFNFNPELAFKIISTLESSGKSWARGDAGNSFGLTQVHGPYFMKWLSTHPQLSSTTGLNPEELAKMSGLWKQNIRKVARINVWKDVNVDQQKVKDFIENNPKKVIRRREGTTIKLNPGNFPGVVKQIGNRFVGKEINIDLLEKEFGLSPTPFVIRRLQGIVDSYITDRVVKSAIAQMVVAKNYPDASAKFYNTFSSKNVKQDRNAKRLSDWVSRSDFMTKVRSVINYVRRYGYDTNVPGAYNMYQLVAIANGSGTYRVKKFLKDRSPFGAGHVHYLQKANPVIQRLTGIPTNTITGGLEGFKKSYASLNFAYDEEFEEEPTKIDPLRGVGTKYYKEILEEYEWYKYHMDEVIADLKERYDRDFTENEIAEAIVNTILEKYKHLTEGHLNLIIKKHAEYQSGILYFPDQYADDVKSGKRRFSIRPGDVNMKPNDRVKCKSYSGADIGDVKIIAKKIMSIPRLEKAHGKYIARSLENRFGPDKRFVLIEFEPIDVNFADDDDDDEKKMSEVLIDKEKKLTRGQIKNHYSKPEVRKKIMSRIKGKPVIVYLGIGKNEKILKRNHNNKEIVITNDDPKNNENPNNYFYWVDRRVLSFHQVFGNKTDLGFVDLDIHGEFSLEEAKKYAKELSKELKKKYGSSPTIYRSGGEGIHVEFKVKEMPIDKLRGELKDILTELNEKYENITTGIVKGTGMRTDISTLHNKGSIRVPGSFGESTGNIKQVSGEQNTDEINYGNYPPDGKKYLLDPDNPFPDELIKHSPPQSIMPSSGGYNALDDAFASSKLLDKEYIWLWDETDGRFIYHLNVNNGKRLDPYYDHLTLGKHNNVRKITNEGWRGRIFIYNDNTADVQWYGDKNIKKDAPISVIKGLNNIIEKNNIKKVELERIEGWPSAEWKAEGWKHVEKRRQLEKHMEKRKMMGFDEPDPNFVEELNLKFASSKKKIAILVASRDFYEDEYFIPRKLFVENKFDIDVISDDFPAIGSNGTIINVDKQFPVVSSKDYNALFVCGGKGMIKVSKNKEAQEILKSFIDEKKPVALICHAPLLAAEAKVIKDVEITGWPDIVGKIKRAKGKWTGMPIEKSGLIFSAVGPDEAEDLAYVLSNFLLKKETLTPKKAATEEEEEFWKSHPELKEDEEGNFGEQEELEEVVEEKEEDKKKEEILKKKQPTPKSFKDVVEKQPDKFEEEQSDFGDIFEPEETEWKDVLEEEFKDKDEDDEEEDIPIFGEKLEPPKDKDGNILDRWFDVEEIKPPVMSSDAKSLFSLKNMKDGPSLTKLFENPDAWRFLKENPEIAQKWILPAVIMGIGKKWFDNNSSQLKLKVRKGSDMEEMPFGMFDDGDLSLLIRGVPIEKLPSSRAYISLINKTITDLANKYFSMGMTIDPSRGVLPIGGYIYKSLSREMSRNIANDKGYKEKRVPVCSYCKSRAKKRQSKEIAYFPMKLVKDKKGVKQWYCEECKEQFDRNKDTIFNLNNDVDGKQKQIRNIQERLNNVKKLFADNPSEELKQKIDLYEKNIVSLAVDIKDVRAKIENTKKEQYSLGVQSSNVPYWHTWCPNSYCSGNRVPLTAIDRNNDFWKTDAGLKASDILQKRFGISIFPIQSAEEEEPAKIAFHRIPPDELLDVPFICPHDYTKFTLRSARGKGLNKKGGFFWEPWQHMVWEPIGGRDLSIEEGKEEGVEANQEKVLQQKMIRQTNMYLALLGSKMFSNQHEKSFEEYKNWFDKQVGIYKSRGLSVFDAVKRVEQSRTNGAKQRTLSMYQALGDMSHLDPEIFVSWLGEVGVESKFVEDGTTIEKKNITKKIKAKDRRDDIYIPAIHSWVSKMMESRDNWFDYYHLQDILVNNKIDGIYSNGPGTFFISKVGDSIDEDEIVFGFGCNLVPLHEGGGEARINPFSYKTKKEQEKWIVPKKTKLIPKRPQASIKPKVLKFIGMWKIYPEQMEFVKNWADGKKPVPLNNKIIEYAKSHPEENIAGEIMYSDFYRVGLNQTDTSLSIGDYVLVQALVMPGKYNPEPVVDIRNIRNKSDGHKQIFSKVNAIMNERYVDPASKKLIQEFFDDIKNYGDDPEEMKMYMEDLIEGFEKMKKSSFILSKKAGLDEYNKKRNFDETPEPEGKIEKKNKHRFVIQNHNAEKAKRHFDLRLENDDGTLSSWAVPKHKLPSGKEKLLAIKTEDHPISYMKFEGEIPSGYGKGDMKIHDAGTYKELENSENKIIFKLNGKKENGTYNLFKTDGNRWILTESKIEKEAATPFEKAQKSKERTIRIHEDIQAVAPRFNLQLFEKEIVPKVIEEYNKEAKKMNLQQLPFDNKTYTKWLFLGRHGQSAMRPSLDYYTQNKEVLKKKMFPDSNPNVAEQAFNLYLNTLKRFPQIGTGPISGGFSHEMGHASGYQKDPSATMEATIPVGEEGVGKGSNINIAINEAIASWNGFNLLWKTWKQYGIPRKAWGAWYGFPSYIGDMSKEEFKQFINKIKDLSETKYPSLYYQVSKVLYEYDKYVEPTMYNIPGADWTEKEKENLKRFLEQRGGKYLEMVPEDRREKVRHLQQQPYVMRETGKKVV